MSKKIKSDIKPKTEKFSFLEFSDESPQNIAGAPQITMFGNSLVQIEGCNGIIDYTETTIKISIKRGFITFFGKNFNVVSFYNTILSFSGEVSTLEYTV